VQGAVDFGKVPGPARKGLGRIERISSNGGQILNGPTEVPGGDWLVNARNPQGSAFSLHARTRE
jgi:hypothetical protein